MIQVIAVFGNIILDCSVIAHSRKEMLKRFVNGNSPDYWTPAFFGRILIRCGGCGLAGIQSRVSNSFPCIRALFCSLSPLWWEKDSFYTSVATMPILLIVEFLYPFRFYLLQPPILCYHGILIGNIKRRAFGVD